MKPWGSSVLTRFTYHGVQPDQPANECDSDSDDPSGEAVASGKQPHWIRGVHICLAISSGVLLLNLVLLIIAVVRARSNEAGAEVLPTFKVIYDGDCAVSKGWDIALHLLINILSTAILGASNYTMQTLVAPTREEVNVAHKKGRWLDIGTPSTRNLFSVKGYRAFLWVVLLVTATPFHLLYNSVVFGAFATNVYPVIIAPSNLDPQQIQNYGTAGLKTCFEDETGISWDLFAAHLATGRYTRLDATECFNLENTLRPHGIRAVVRFSDDLSVDDGGDLAFLSLGSNLGYWSYDGPELGLVRDAERFSETTWAFTLPSTDSAVVYDAYNYTLPDCTSSGVSDSSTACNDANQLATWLLTVEPQTLNNVTTYIKTELVTPIIPHIRDISCYSYASSSDYTTNDCLVIETQDRCKLMYNLPLSLSIIATAAIKVVAMFLASRVDRAAHTPPLLTVGDAVASFITQPDETTKGRCWITRHDVSNGTSARPGSQKLRARGRWIQAASVRRWVITGLSCGTTLGVAIYLLTLASQTLGPFKSWFSDYGFGEYSKQGYPIIDIPNLTTAPALASVLVANTPQFVITISYYFYNNVLTTMLASSEYNSYGTKRAGLRVSWPKKGTAQRSTYWLSIPYKYSVPLLLTYTTLHWIVSQSLFYTQTIEYDQSLQAKTYNEGQESGVAYSPVATLVSIVIGGVMVVILLALGFCRRYKSYLPLAGSSSIAISASCHPGDGEDLTTAAFHEVKWGETETFPEGVDAGDGVEVGHCSFSAGDVAEPDPQRLYI
ncbi:hypothetical protein BJX65DRAFT_304331 [Aspergillus insuetus]